MVEIMTTGVWEIIGVLGNLLLVLLLGALVGLNIGIVIKYKLSIGDFFRFWFKQEYSLYVYVDHLYAKVRRKECSYDYFAHECLTLYNKDRFTKVKSEFQNNRTYFMFSVLEEVVGDKEFASNLFKNDSLKYDYWHSQMIEWRNRAERTEYPATASDGGEVKSNASAENSAAVIVEPKRKLSEFFSDADVDECMAALRSYYESVGSGLELAALVIALKETDTFANVKDKDLHRMITEEFGMKHGCSYQNFADSMQKYNENALSDKKEEKMIEFTGDFRDEIKSIGIK